MFQVQTLKGKSFLDIGSGSGLFSLAARRLGANVQSFDYDQKSVKCTKEIRKRFFQNDKKWKIKNGDILNKKFVNKLGFFDIVYAWGVLHHTGHMWLAIQNSAFLVKKNGFLFLAIYNDQGIKTRIWWVIKWTYNKLPTPLNKAYGISLAIIIQLILTLKHVLLLQPRKSLFAFKNYKKSRAMNPLIDYIDWVGGFPFEFSSLENIVFFLEKQNFKAVKIKKSKGLACHEIVFKKI